MEECERKKYLVMLMNCFKGPVKQSLVYTYYQAYIQDTDMYNYIVSRGLNKDFTSEELNILENERRPSYLSLLLLFKVLQTCCSPPLASIEDSVWKTVEDVEKYSSHMPVETMLTALVSSYKKFLVSASCITIDDCCSLVDIMNHNVSLFIEKVSAMFNFSRWTEERERLRKMFHEIQKFDFSSVSSSPIDLIELEVHFRAEMDVKYLNENLRDIDELSFDLQQLTVENFTKSCGSKIQCHEVKYWLKIMSDQNKKFCWIAGEHGVGKSTLAALLVTRCNARYGGIDCLAAYRLVTVVSVSNILPADATSIFKMAFPLSDLFINTDETMKNFSMENKTLIILDDVSNASDTWIRNLYDSIVNIPNLIVWFLGRLSPISRYAKDDDFCKHSIFLQLNGLKEDKILSLSEEWTSKVVKSPSMQTKLQDNLNRLGRILKYPAVLYDVCEMWKDCYGSLQQVFTASELMWEILAWKGKKILKINIKLKGPGRIKFLQWLQLAGELSVCSLKLDMSLDKAALEDLETDLISHFPVNGKEFIDALFPLSVTYAHVSCLGIRSSNNKPILEYFSSWYLVEQLLANKRMCDVTSGFTDIFPLVVFAAGHLERLQNEGNITVQEERRIIKALINYREGSFDDFYFIQEFVAELKCIKRLVEIVIDETEYNEEWNLNVAKVQQKSLEVLLSYVSPVRLIFLADEPGKNYELPSVMNYVCRVDISIWLDSIPHFAYGNTENLDCLLRPFLAELVIPKVDLIAGSLSASVLKNMPISTATQHLVLLKLKVVDLETLNVALSLPVQLPNLLWLELKLDMMLPKVSEVSSTKVELFDIHLRGLDDSDVTTLADMLATIHLKYSGIHLDDSSLTPEGVYALLKELGKRGVILRAEQDSINRFRRWYYPSLNGVLSVETLTEQQYINLIGHDDSTFYSDHYVHSSQFVTILDAWNLKNYLKSQKNIVHFKYEASNITFIKQLNGEVEITFKGNYKEVIEKEIMTNDGNEQLNENYSAVIDMY